MRNLLMSNMEKEKPLRYTASLYPVACPNALSEYSEKSVGTRILVGISIFHPPLHIILVHPNRRRPL